MANGLYGAGVLVLLSALVLAFMLFWHRRERERTAQMGYGPRDDYDKMMILLQTMRDLLGQQKDLARQLNESLDKRVVFIKETVDAAVQDLNALRQASREIARELENSRLQIEAVKQEAQEARRIIPLRKLDEDRPSTPDPPVQQAAHHRPVRERLTVIERKQATSTIERGDLEADGLRDHGSLQVFAMPHPQEPERDILDSWVGLDFGGDEAEQLGFDVPETPPSEPSDVEAARDAFRALLDIDEKPKAPKVASAKPKATAKDGNGSAGPIQARVLNYSDAGMTVAQIAQELGISKGEVRLILSLRDEKGK